MTDARFANAVEDALSALGDDLVRKEGDRYILTRKSLPLRISEQPLPKDILGAARVTDDAKVGAILLSDALARRSGAVQRVLLHEVAHLLSGTQNHAGRWVADANRLCAAYASARGIPKEGFDITISGISDFMGKEEK